MHGESSIGIRTLLSVVCFGSVRFQLTGWSVVEDLVGGTPWMVTALNLVTIRLTSGENEPRPGVVVRRQDR